MRKSVLDIFVLSALDRGAETPYELQKKLEISLGASLPSLRRLTKAKLVSRSEGKAKTNRPRHLYSLTDEGRAMARSGWRDLMSGESVSDLDSVLRIADMALHYRASRRKLKEFLDKVAASRLMSAKQAAVAVSSTRVSPQLSYGAMRNRLEAARFGAEANILRHLSNVFSDKSNK